MRLPICDLRFEIANQKSQIESPLLLIRTVATRQIIVAASDSARAFGIRPTMTLGEAHALCAIVQHEEHDSLRDRKSLEALARWMMRFSPVVALPPLPPASGERSRTGEGRGEGSPNTEPSGSRSTLTLTLSRRERGQDGIFLDLTGCDRIFDGLNNIAHRIRTALSKMRISANLAIASTPGAAWAMTFRSSDSDTLENLPPVALRLNDQNLQALHHLGLETVGQIMDLPRELLPARFGPLLSLRIDQLLGRIPEPLVPLEYLTPITARMDFDGLVDSLEAIWIAFKRLIEQIVRQLLRHGRGAREIELEFYRAYAQTIRTTIRLSRPSRDPVNLFNLMRCALENVETEEGFLGIQLTVSSSERITDEQIHLMGDEEFAGQIELDHLIERLRVRLGELIIVRPELIESYLPESAYSWHGVSTRVQSASTRVENPCHVETVRPLHLLDRPREIRVMVSPSDDRDGKPVLFAHCGDAHRILHSVGPERIAGQWWQGHFRTRDYFDVEDEQGKRSWIFRVQETGKWFLHGEFE